uniref:Transcriptional regulator n=1 Tax=Gongylonema pulchrum TaxID=637853 RepID=A0A183DIK9_9BILA
LVIFEKFLRETRAGHLKVLKVLELRVKLAPVMRQFF